MLFFNSHIHTNASPDCAEDVRNICQAAINMGLSGIAITDHFSGSMYYADNSYNVAKKSTSNARHIAKEHQGKLMIFAGAEIDEMLWSPEYIKGIISEFDFDIILASVHRVRSKINSNYLSRIDFSDFNDNELFDIAHEYFIDVLETAEKCDFDVLSHLTLILRYICGKYHRNLSIDPYREIIDKILTVVISRDKALEVNTSEISGIGLMPEREILARYYALGGRKFTIGTDAHLKENLLLGFDFAIDTMRDLGFDAYYYYKNRQPIRVEFDKKN